MPTALMTLANIPFIPAQAGIQGHMIGLSVLSPLGPRFRGDERDRLTFASAYCALRGR